MFIVKHLLDSSDSVNMLHVPVFWPAHFKLVSLFFFNDKPSKNTPQYLGPT